jgi:hypothetical protein
MSLGGMMSSFDFIMYFFVRAEVIGQRADPSPSALCPQTSAL